MKDLGLYIEVEAIDDTGNILIDELKEQCMKYFGFFGIDENDCIKYSYSDLLMEKSTLSKV